MPIKGSKVGTVKALKKSLKKASSSGNFLNRIPKDDSMVVRFMTEPDEWVEYREHYSQADGFFPCSTEDCRGCDSDSKEERRTSQKYLMNALDIDKGEVLALSLAKTLAETIVKYYEKYGTLMDRDYELSREGDGLDTKYFAAPESPSRLNTAKFEPIDLWARLEAQLDSEDDEDDDDDEDEDDEPRTRPSRSRPVSKSSTRSRTTTRTAAKKTAAKRPLRRTR